MKVIYRLFNISQRIWITKKRIYFQDVNAILVECKYLGQSKMTVLKQGLSLHMMQTQTTILNPKITSLYKLQSPLSIDNGL